MNTLQVLLSNRRNFVYTLSIDLSVYFFSVHIKKIIGLNGYACDFSVNYGSADVDSISNIHKYFIKKHDLKEKNVWIN